MPATLLSLPPEVLLRIIELLHCPPWTNDVHLAWRWPTPAPHPLCALSLVSHELRRLAQPVLFRSVRLVSRAQARAWRATAAAAHTREMRLWYRHGAGAERGAWGGGQGASQGPLLLSELFGEGGGEVEHVGGAGKARIELLSIGQLDEGEFDGGVYESAGLEGELHDDLAHPRSSQGD